MSYTAPLADMQFVLTELADLAGINQLPGYEDATPDLIASVLEEAGKLASGVLAPLNKTGDTQGSKLVDGQVKTPDGWQAAYQTYTESGWNSLASRPEHGGQGLPWAVAAAVEEMWNSANMAFALCPMLTQGAIHAIELHGNDEQKACYLPNMVAGVWTGTMNLTEPQAGSDLAAVRSKAVPEGDHYRISGQKIFITYGDHDLTDNVIHLVLARLPDAPAGVKGISLFIVPKFLVNADGSLGARNDVHCVSLEHKLGIHASPTCVMAFGDTDGAIGYLVGTANRGLEYMFSMMNKARHSVGVEGVGIAERAYQHALAYARERVQGRPVGDTSGAVLPIIHHPDVRRMLLTMRAQTEAMRALALVTAASFDQVQANPDAAQRQHHQALLDLLIPVVKGWCTETGVDIASLGVQIHGGMGYVEETGAAQYFRDARITPIYEGTTGIQASDLVGRKILRDQGQALSALLQQMRDLTPKLAALNSIQQQLETGINALDQAGQWLLSAAQQNPQLPFAAAVDMLHLTGIVTGGWLLAKSALIAQQHLNNGDTSAFYTAKIHTANFYADHILSRAPQLLSKISQGAASTLAFAVDAF